MSEERVITSQQLMADLRAEVERLRAENDGWQRMHSEAIDHGDSLRTVVDAARALVSMPWGTPIGDTIPALRVLAAAVRALDANG